MSDTYKIGATTVTALGGGWYELKHSSLAEPKKVHGKEAADAEAGKLNEASEGHMEQQGDLNTTATLTANQTTDGDTRTPAERVQEADMGVPPPPPPPEKPAETADQQTGEDKTKDDRIAELEKQLAASQEKEAAATGGLSDFQKRFDEFLKSAQPLVTTVQKAEEDPEEQARAAHGQVPIDAPRQYSGQMDPKAKKAFKAAGIDVKTIVLEENESIPPTGLFVGHNGRSYVIMPGEEVDVPDFLLGVLNDAVMSAPVVDAKTQKVLGYRNRSKYPYRLVNDRG